MTRLLFVYDDEVVHTAETSAVPSEGDTVLMNDEPYANDEPRLFEVRDVWWNVFKHEVVAEAYLEVKDDDE